MFILFTLFSILVLFILFLLIHSPGKLPVLTTKDGQRYPNGLAEKITLQIGGVSQGLFIMSEDIEKPVLLFLHGGPGSPEMPIIYSNEAVSRLENEFTVCYWDQRGAGMSLRNIPEATMTLEQLIADTLEVTTYLQKRFKQEKIFLMGHSWGSYLGVKTISQAPEHYHAYIGMGQLADQKSSEKLAYNYMDDHATKIDDQKALKKLRKYPVTDPAFPQMSYIMGVRSSLMNHYGIGITHTKFSMFTILKQLVFFKGYTLLEKINFLRGSLFSLKHLFHYTTADNLMETTYVFERPIFITHGKHDYQVSYELARKYFETIQAPQKAFYSFSESAHSPIIEERDLFIKNLKQIKKSVLHKD